MDSDTSGSKGSCPIPKLFPVCYQHRLQCVVHASAIPIHYNFAVRPNGYCGDPLAIIFHSQQCPHYCC
eukprot:2753225-Karenia_brevis.AAC.1